MRVCFEFSFHHVATLAADGHPDPSLAMLGALGWEIRGIAAVPEGGFLVALQRPLGEEHPLPGADTLAASLEEPLAAPTATSAVSGSTYDPVT